MSASFWAQLPPAPGPKSSPGAGRGQLGAAGYGCEGVGGWQKEKQKCFDRGCPKGGRRVKRRQRST